MDIPSVTTETEIPSAVSPVMNVLWQHQPDFRFGAGRAGRWYCQSLLKSESCGHPPFATMDDFLLHQATALAEAVSGDTETVRADAMDEAAKIAEHTLANHLAMPEAAHHVSRQIRIAARGADRPVQREINSARPRLRSV